MGYFMDERRLEEMRKSGRRGKGKGEDTAVFVQDFSWYVRGRGDGEYVEPISSL